MILLWFFIGMLLIYGISRYNESNKLFWALLVAFLTGFGVTTMVIKSKNNGDKSKNSSVQVKPTQAYYAALGDYYLLANDSYDTPEKAISEPVSKVILPALKDEELTLSMVSGVIRDPYIHLLPNPPNNVELIDTS